MRVQVIVVRAGVTSAWLPPNAAVGTAHWVSRDACRHLIELGIVKLPGPTETPQAGPSSRKS